MSSKVFLVVKIFIVVFVFIIIFLTFPLKLNLKGSENNIIYYGNRFVEPGFKASYFNHNLSKKVYVKNNINYKKLGTYEITYKLKNMGVTVIKTRTIKIVDKEKTAITLTGEKIINICPNKDYEELGYKAIDNYDGDITKKVKITKTSNTITYSVTDSSGNKTSVSREIKKEDKENPNLTLNGNQTIYVYLNSEFNDPGYTVNDNCDDLTGKVQINGSVDTSKLGTYEINYNIKDSSNNEASVIRKVIVINRPTVVKRDYSSNLSCGEAGVIYLTFDDGPNGNYTPVILDVLKKYNVSATFFVTSSGPNYLIKREKDEGHAIGLHSSSHNYSRIYTSTEAFWNDINIVNNRLIQITGEGSKLLRFPGGSSNTVSRRYNNGIMSVLSNEVEQNGYSYFDWNISSGDAVSYIDPSSLYSNVVSNLSKDRGNVILMHDIKSHTSKAIDSIISYGINNGYVFKKLDSNVICKQKINN